mmetsp:Transcript_25173/g.65691  ORF Transcript_25173/g.65691 Transcript_25173/m.65691 type:complete len:265 (+) Transcript_25173:533-1327(+)
MAVGTVSNGGFCGEGALPAGVHDALLSSRNAAGGVAARSRSIGGGDSWRRSATCQSSLGGMRSKERMSSWAWQPLEGSTSIRDASMSASGRPPPGTFQSAKGGNTSYARGAISLTLPRMDGDGSITAASSLDGRVAVCHSRSRGKCSRSLNESPSSPCGSPSTPSPCGDSEAPRRHASTPHASSRKLAAGAPSDGSAFKTLRSAASVRMTEALFQSSATSRRRSSELSTGGSVFVTCASSRSTLPPALKACLLSKSLKLVLGGQ